jgi:UDP-GlcNAc:undecaprenyl-phosphate GlcNAc-1-phosphate transferase
VIALLLPVGLAFIASLAVTPAVRRLAFACGATDIPDARRVHSRPTARAGGVGVILAAVLGMALGGARPATLGPGALCGGALLLVVGLIDDIVSMRAHTKLFAQLIAATLAVASGLHFTFFGPETSAPLAALNATLTVAWIVLLTNAFNLSDGLDGLASGIATFSFLSLAAVGIRAGDPALGTTALVLAGALLGFLPYNFNPATIFLGDAGSLVIGYALAVLPLVGTHGTPLPPLAAILLVALPATDTLIAIARRFLSRCLRAWGEGPFWGGLSEGLKNTMSPDRRHIHHRLLDLGLSQRRAVLLLYLAATSTSGLAYLVAGSPGWPIDLFALGLGATVIGLVRALGIDELQPARSGLVLPVIRRLARHGWLVLSADFCLTTIAYATALALTGHPGIRPLDIAAAAIMVAGMQLILFGVLGIYRTAWWVTEVSGFGLLLRACALGTIAGYAGLRLFHLPTGGATALVHYGLILPAVTVMRFSQVLLANAAGEAGSADRTLIYGTAPEARQALRRLRHSGAGPLEPVGFIEFRPRLQGRELARLPVLGTLDGLPRIVRERRARHLVIADPTLRGEALDWVRAVCRHLDVQVHRYVERLVPYDGRVTIPTEMAHFRPGPGVWGRAAARRQGNGNGRGHAQAQNGNGAGHQQVPVDGPASHNIDAPRE